MISVIKFSEARTYLDGMFTVECQWNVIRLFMSVRCSVVSGCCPCVESLVNESSSQAP